MNYLQQNKAGASAERLVIICMLRVAKEKIR